MRTTLDIDDDVLTAAKELAEARKTTAGRVISDLARQTLTRRLPEEETGYRGGFKLLPRTGQIITSEMVEKWLQEEP
jgi:predicted transcriptional regulator